MTSAIVAGAHGPAPCAEGEAPAVQLPDRGRGHDPSLELERFRAAMDAVPDAIYLTDRRTMRLVDLNRAAAELLGRSREALIGMPTARMLGIDEERLRQVYDSVIAGEPAHERVQMNRELPDGTMGTIELRRRAYRSDEGWLIVTIATDITAHLAAERALRDKVRQQGLNASFSHAALEISDLNELLEAAVAAATAGLDADCCGVSRLAPDNLALVLEVGAGWNDGWLGTVVAERPIASASLLASEPVFIDEPRTPLHRAHGIRAGIEVRIGIDHAPYGALGVYWQHPRAASAQDAAFLQGIANALDIAIERRHATQKLARMAQYDSLTGLANRDLFRATLSRTLTEAAERGGLVGVLYIDLDEFKTVNDTKGHDAGDRLLAQVAHRLLACVRSTDTVGRLGGDEFAVIVTHLSCPEDASIVAGKIVAQLSKPFDVDVGSTLITASIGIAIYPLDGAEAEVLLKNADSAMYQGKERGRNNYQSYSIEIDTVAAARRALAHELRAAIDGRQFELHYQPQIALDDGRVVGVEAMLRWWHPSRGLLLAGEFIDLAEETGLIVPIAQWALESACTQANEWRANGAADLFVAVNFSPVELLASDLPHHAERALKRTRLAPTRLEIELTDCATRANSAAFAASVDELKRLGVSIAIDDFGTGLSSLAALRDLPVRKLKLDPTFTRDIDTRREDQVIVRSIAAMARQLRLKVVAKEVETLEQVEQLRAAGVELAQGYLFGAPMPAEHLSELFEREAASDANCYRSAPWPLSSAFAG